MHHLKTKIKKKSSKYSFASSSANDVIAGAAAAGMAPRCDHNSQFFVIKIAKYPPFILNCKNLLG